MADKNQGPQVILAPDDIDDADLRSFYQLWKTTCGSGIGADDMDFLEFPSLVPRCIKLVLKAGDSIDDAAVVFEGDSMVKTFGVDITGQRVSQLKRFVTAERLVRTCYKEKAAVKSGPERVIFERNSYMSVEHVCCPISDDGTNVSGLVYAVTYTNL